MDIHHHMVHLLLDGRLHLAPIGNDVQRILDLGTGMSVELTYPACSQIQDHRLYSWKQLAKSAFKGTGIWAIEMGMFPLLEKVISYSRIQMAKQPK